MTDPSKSQYQATPWQPTVDTSASDSSDEKGAASQYDGIYGGSATDVTTSPASSTPDTNTYSYAALSMAYTTAPDLIPMADPNSGGSGGAPPAAVGEAFSIQLGVLMSTEQSCLDATNTTDQGYQTLASVVKNAISSDSIFGQIVGTKSTANPDTKAGWLEPTGAIYDKLDSEGTGFASAVIPQMEQLLEALGNTIEAMGQFTAMLNNAGQMYTYTDSQSAFPAPGSMPGPTT